MKTPAVTTGNGMCGGIKRRKGRDAQDIGFRWNTALQLDPHLEESEIML